MPIPQEVILAFDIFGYVYNLTKSLIKLIALILYYENVFTKCLNYKDGFEELNGIRSITDFQSRKIMNLKLPFICVFLLFQSSIFSVFCKDLDDLVGAVGSLSINQQQSKESDDTGKGGWPGARIIRKVKALGGDKESSLRSTSLTHDILFSELFLLYMQIKILTRIFRIRELFLSDFWLKMNGIEDDKALISSIFTYLATRSTDALTDKRATYFFDNLDSFLKMNFPNFSTVGRDSKAQVNALMLYKDDMSCEDPSKVLVLLLLIFDENCNKTITFYMLYIFICTYREFSGLSFSQGLEKVLRNEDNVGSRLINVSGGLLSNPVKIIMKYKSEYSVSNVLSSIPDRPIQHPLNLSEINISVFGLKLCFVLLELTFINPSEYIHKYLPFFLGSRMESSQEVMLAFEIITLLLRSASGFEEAAAALMYDNQSFQNFSIKILKSHNIDISSLKDLFGICLKAKSQYPLFEDVVIRTDYQLKSLKKKGKSRKKIKLTRK
ncbi:membrane-associated protein [Cryptosporidium sp. chipmunk genotype I]|uniref:membrane-associated protein n=1 Tax=Cryptosporidium sp. chipmunk genotype I TaxID=1280935 RepID=UPI00351A4F54|nr:membrane-associated protein [Cryptosporidium sp. chipmunk genotype I]